jgi:hypothetical protein
MTRTVTMLDRAPGIEDSGWVSGAARERPDPEVPQRARLRTFTAKYKLVAGRLRRGFRWREGCPASPGGFVFQPRRGVAARPRCWRVGWVGGAAGPAAAGCA